MLQMTFRHWKKPLVPSEHGRITSVPPKMEPRVTFFGTGRVSQQSPGPRNETREICGRLLTDCFRKSVLWGSVLQAQVISDREAQLAGS
jgi:hypothetical protein